MKEIANLNVASSYLLGLICGRGHILKKDKRIIIEFAHKNKLVPGILACPKCGNLATRKERLSKKNYICRNCKFVVDSSLRKTYDQKASTINSINKSIIPFLSKTFNAAFDITGNDHMTFLIMDFNSDTTQFNTILAMFNGATDFDSFSIPDQLYLTNVNNKLEFVNGFLDTAGFFNSGGWLNRKGTNGTGRMRAYIQIVRNWKMPVLICNFLKNELSLPIHTIDWGHPNISDAYMKDYFNSGTVSWSREHQVKFFPEYYKHVLLRVEHKQKMLEELIEYNLRIGFNKNEDCDPPKLVSKTQLKPYHPAENDIRIPSELRKHYDAYWQICSDIGCIFAKEKLLNSSCPSLYYLSGAEEGTEEKIAEEFETERIKLTEKSMEQYKRKPTKENALRRAEKSNEEFKLYEPISKWFKQYLEATYHNKAEVYDTSKQFLDKYIAKREYLYEAFERYWRYKIKPDIVGFLINSKELGFIEVKINELTLKDMGQLLGYCLVAVPRIAILVSPKKPSINLIKILRANKTLLQYSTGKIILIGTWTGSKIEFIGV